MDLFFEAFLRDRAGDLRRLAAATRGEMEADDLASEAYLMAIRLGERWGREVVFNDPADQDALFAALFVTHVKRGNWSNRLALRYDGVGDDDDSGCLAEVLAASNTSDPLEHLLQRQELEAAETAIEDSYSQAAAYLVIFTQHGNSMARVYTYLIVPRSTLQLRMAGAIASVKVQPSIFDGVECIPDDFMTPPYVRSYVAKVEESRGVEQWAWEF